MKTTSLNSLLQKDTYQDYLRRLDARALLEHYGAEHCTEQSGGDGTTEIVHSCLLDRVEPHHTNGDAHPSAACNIDRKLYCCYSLGWGGDLFRLIQKLENKESLADTMTTVGQFLTGAVQENTTLMSQIDSWFAGGATIDLPSYSDRILEGWGNPHPYWGQRGISEEAVRTLRLGYDERERRIVFPHFVEGSLVGWQKRVIPGETVPDYPKYRNSSGFPKSETLYNLDIARQYPRVCVVESPMSVARAVSLGIPNVVATFGAKVTSEQIRLLSDDFETVYVWFDRDGAGLSGEKKIVESLYKRTEVLVVAPDRGKDLGDSSVDDICLKLSQAVPAALRLGDYDQYRRTHGHQTSFHPHTSQR